MTGFDLRTLAVAVGDGLVVLADFRLADFPTPGGMSFDQTTAQVRERLAALRARTRVEWKQKLLDLVSSEFEEGIARSKHGDDAGSHKEFVDAHFHFRQYERGEEPRTSFVAGPGGQLTRADAAGRTAMRELTWIQRGSPVSHGAIAHLERTLAVSLPVDFREFLAAHQGGAPNETDFALADPDKRGVGIGTFLRVEGDDVDAIAGAKRILTRQDLPEPLIPIAIGPGGDFVCLDCSTQPARVVYWHHARVGPESVTPVANGFGDFLDLLRVPS